MNIRTTERRGFLVIIAAAALVFGLALFAAGAHASTKGVCGSESGTLGLLASYPPYWGEREEPLEHRCARLRDIARAIDGASDEPLHRAMLARLGWGETKFAGYVYEGRCSDGPRGERECDRGKAKGPWQIQDSEEFSVPDGVDEQAKLALRLLLSHYRRCGNSVPDKLAGAFAGYGTGGSCVPSKRSKERAHGTRVALERLRRDDAL